MNESSSENPESTAEETKPEIAIDVIVPLDAVQKGLTQVGADRFFKPTNPRIKSVSIDDNGVVIMNGKPTDTQLILENGGIKIKFFSRGDGATSICLSTTEDQNEDEVKTIDLEKQPELAAIWPIIHIVANAHILETRSPLLKPGSLIPPEEHYIMVKRVPLNLLRDIISRADTCGNEIIIADDGKVTMNGELLFYFKIRDGCLEIRHDLITNACTFPCRDFQERCSPYKEAFMGVIACAFKEFQE